MQRYNVNPVKNNVQICLIKSTYDVLRRRYISESALDYGSPLLDRLLPYPAAPAAAGSPEGASEPTATRFFLPGNRIGPNVGKGAAGRYGGKSANHFYKHFDVEDIGEAFTISDWFPVDQIPLLAVKMRSQMSRQWWLHRHKKRGGVGGSITENGIARAVTELRDAQDSLKDSGSNGEGSPRADRSPDAADQDDEEDEMPSLGNPGLATPQWVERAYHALYSTRIPASEDKTPWGGKGGKRKSGLGGANNFVAVSAGHDFLHGQRLAVEEFRALEDTIVYIACLRPRTHEDAKPLIELMAALLIHIVGELQVTYWDMQHHFQTMQQSMEADMHARVAARMDELEAEVAKMAAANEDAAAAKARFRSIIFRMTSDAAANSKTEMAELQTRLRAEMRAGRSVSEKIVAQQSELDDLKTENERVKMELAMASIDLDAARGKIRKGDAVAKALDERGLESQDAGVRKAELDELLRRGGCWSVAGAGAAGAAGASGAAGTAGAGAPPGRGYRGGDGHRSGGIEVGIGVVQASRVEIRSNHRCISSL